MNRSVSLAPALALSLSTRMKCFINWNVRCEWQMIRVSIKNLSKQKVYETISARKRKGQNVSTSIEEGDVAYSASFM